MTIDFNWPSSSTSCATLTIADETSGNRSTCGARIAPLKGEKVYQYETVILCLFLQIIMFDSILFYYIPSV